MEGQLTVSLESKSIFPKGTITEYHIVSYRIVTLWNTV